MKTRSSGIFLLLFSPAAPSFAAVVVSSPSNGQTVGSTVSYVATATTNTCAKGVASMGVYLDDKLVYTVNGTELKTTLAVSPGGHSTVVEEWDYCGGATYLSMAITVSARAGVHVISPSNLAEVSSPVNYVATGTTDCSAGVASMGIYVNGQLLFVENGALLNTQLRLDSGARQTVVEEWDKCGGASYTPVDLTVQGDDKVVSNLQASDGWNGWGELAPNYDICVAPCSGVSWGMLLHVSSPSLSGNATEFKIGGSTPYSDVLWSLPLLGQNTTQDLPDSTHTTLPTLHNFTYDAYFYGSELELTQVLEFDINMYMNGLGFIWGTQCRIAGGNEWDVWDNPTAHWVPTGVACNPLSSKWNHVTIQARRRSDNSLLYESISLNGMTTNINMTTPTFSVPAGWWGLTANYQMDGNFKQSPNTTYLDNFSLTYW